MSGIESPQQSVRQQYLAANNPVRRQELTALLHKQLWSQTRILDNDYYTYKHKEPSECPSLYLENDAGRLFEPSCDEFIVFLGPAEDNAYELTLEMKIVTFRGSLEKTIRFPRHLFVPMPSKPGFVKIYARAVMTKVWGLLGYEETL